MKESEICPLYKEFEITEFYDKALKGDADGGLIFTKVNKDIYFYNELGDELSYAKYDSYQECSILNVINKEQFIEQFKLLLRREKLIKIKEKI